MLYLCLFLAQTSERAATVAGAARTARGAEARVSRGTDWSTRAPPPRVQPSLRPSHSQVFLNSHFIGSMIRVHEQRLSTRSPITRLQPSLPIASLFLFFSLFSLSIIWYLMLALSPALNMIRSPVSRRRSDSHSFERFYVMWVVTRLPPCSSPYSF